MAETTAKDIPIRPYAFPKIINNNNSEPILTMAEKPTIVDSSACIFAIIIAEMEDGIIEIIMI